jgi:hypothetical protein
MRHFIFFALVLVACTRQSAPPPAAPPVDPQTFRMPLSARLAREAQARPTGTPRVEEVMAALERGGLTLDRNQQVLASTVGAAYCSSAVTPKGMAVAVCEYPAEDVARRGLEYSHRTFDRLIPGRRLSLNRKTMLTVTGAADADATAATRIFAAL